MNARQKAKKYKKEIEFLKSRQIDTSTLITVVDYKVVPVKAVECVSLEEYGLIYNSIQDRIDRIVKEHLLEELSKHTNEYVEFEKDKDTKRGYVKYTAQLLVGVKQ